jgi:tRNA uridine 5-carbamoylmethylation protein Kti12
MKLIINRGAPGSGKSTGAKKLIDAVNTSDIVDGVICSADSYPGLYDKDGGFHPELLSKAHGECMAKAIRATMIDTPLVIIDNTSTTAVEVSPYVLLSQAHGYELQIHRYTCGSALEHFRRNIHKVPLATIERMLNNLDQPLMPWWPAEMIIDTSK